jgi:hypothetical protein
LLHEGRDVDPHVLTGNFAVAKFQKVQDPKAGGPLAARSSQDAPHHVSRPKGLIDHEVVAVKSAHRLSGYTLEVGEKLLIILAGGFPAPHLATRRTDDVMLHVFGQRANDTVHVVLSLVLEVLIDNPIHLFSR